MCSIPTIADASEAIGQNVQEKAANKLGGHQSHARDARFMPIVLPGEGDMIVRDVDKTMIGDGDTMSIAAEVTQDLFRTRRLKQNLNRVPRRVITSRPQMQRYNLRI